MKTILNLAAGKMRPLTDEKKPFLVNVDTMYAGHRLDEEENLLNIEYMHKLAEQDIPPNIREHYIKMDVDEFMERYKYTFDLVTVYRYLEHVPRNEILYFIYMLSTCVRVGGIVDIIVPDYQVLAGLLIHEDDIIDSPNFEAHDILLTTELLNEPNCPHASIWTPERLVKFFKLEGRFAIESIIHRFEYDGRDIYLRMLARRTK